METIRILGVRITPEVKDITGVQEILTRYGCVIKTRLGLHEADEDGRSRGGLLLVELTGEAQEMDHFEKALRGIEHLVVGRMDFPA
ncbi:MAG TPA: hypothetical protein P5550_09630 [Bacteroidales bacterium]|nr:hypothetical protein [Bacteroidales bacterium]HRZ75757.1 hypothetical protein [Bacteroidales bacterium]